VRFREDSAVSGNAPDVTVVDVVILRPVQRGWLTLVLERAKDVRCPGSWEMVHGRVEPGEPLPAAARRELFEETGLKPERLLSVTMHQFLLVPKGTVQTCAVFAAIVAPDAPVVLSEEHSRHAWLTPSQARRRFSWPHEPRVLDDARKLLGQPNLWDVLDC